MKLKVGLILSLLILIFSGCTILKQNKVDDSIKNFQDCTKKYPVMESSPRQCRIPNGTVFVETLAPNEKKKTESPKPICKNLCGDGICQEIVCLSTDCPCPETASSCPQDCANKNSATTTGENQSGIANPASVNCEKIGGKVEIRSAKDGSQSGYCLFPNGQECEEWALFRNECRPKP